jgi:uncharacterized protein (DUF1810 family)
MGRLDRFRAAQDAPGSGFDDALAEIEAGGKTGHWIWYVFPQIAGLGSSSMSRSFAITDAAEAADYLRDDTLRSRLLIISTAIGGQLAGGCSLAALMGSDIDARKLVSSLTLFEHVARTLHAAGGPEDCEALGRAAERVLTVAAAQGYPRCAHTMRRVGHEAS